MADRVVVNARAFWESGQKGEELLLAEGFEVVRTAEPGPQSDEVLIPHIEGADAIIGATDGYTARLFAECPRLKVVSRWGVGIDSVDLRAATEAGVAITNTPGTTTDAVADFTWALLLAVARNVPQGDVCMHSGGWADFRGVLVVGKTLGLVGFGQIGQGVARRAAGFDMTILVYDPLQAGQEHPDCPPVEFVSLEELLARSDFVSLHAAVTPETRNMINAERLKLMKPSARLVNTGRGALVDEEALIGALEAGQIAAAAVDVYQQEPLPADHPLRRAPRCILTPHNAFNAQETAELTSLMTAQNIVDMLRGHWPKGLCNPEVVDSAAFRLRDRL
jgi:phosphoglycerate dehydrogenase-like enzyme